MPFVLKTKNKNILNFNEFYRFFLSIRPFLGGDTRIIQKAGDYFNSNKSYQNKDKVEFIKNLLKVMS